MKAKATIRLGFPSVKQLKSVSNALLPEISNHAGTRARAKLEKDGVFLVLTVEAEDTVALRSALNAYLRWISSVSSVMKVLEQV
jgi:tRNA threonylcarbamoyladenosine modification (KEOPS) complex  Pcc1 subunit